LIKNKISFLDLCHNRKHKKMYRTLEKDYIDGLVSFPLIPIQVHEKMKISRFLQHYPDFEQKTKIRLSRREKQSLSICDCDDYLIDAAMKFSEDRRDEIRQFFLNIDFGNIFCLNSIEITAISLMKPNPQILRLLYSQKVSVKKTSQGYASMAIFLMNRFTQPYQSKTKRRAYSMISRRVISKIFFTKLHLIGQQHLPTQPFRGLRCEIEPNYINFMPFLHAYGENRIEIMLLDDLRWFSQIIQQQNLPASLSGSEPEQEFHPLLAQLIKYIKSILFSKSSEVCFKICMFYVIVYTKRLLLNKNRLSEPVFLEFMFKCSEEIYAMFSLLYIDDTRKYHSLESLKGTNPKRYRKIEIYAKRFSFIVEQLENIHNGSLDLPISELFGQQKGETPFQKIVLYILSN
jgi:hypothetical protein